MTARLRGPSALLLAAALAGTMSSMGCTEPPRESGSVVLVHGLGRSGRSMLLLDRRLEAAGYRVIRYDYPSTVESFDRLVDSLATVVDACCADEAGPTHFVSHSMGGVLVRALLRDSVPPEEGRVVMLSPPNQGSEIIDAFSPSRLLIGLLGPAGAALRTDSTGVPASLGPARFSLGIIAGDRSVTRLGSWLVPGPDDGLVGVDQTRVEGADDFLVVPATHTMIMNRSDVADAVIHFLAEGRFPGGGSAPADSSGLTPGR